MESEFMLFSYSPTRGWVEISNPIWNSKISDESLCSEVLKNTFNKYVEYMNCGSKYRIIRREDYPEALYK